MNNMLSSLFLCGGNPNGVPIVTLQKKIGKKWKEISEGFSKL